MGLHIRRLAVLWTCATTFAIVPVAGAQVTPDAPASASKPAAKTAVAADSRMLPKPQRVYSQPYAKAVPLPDCDWTKGKDLDKVTHLRRAAQHLMAAGKTDLAGQVTREAELEAKIEQICRLQIEVQELREFLAADPTIILHVKVMELQVSKMRKLGFDFQTAEGDSLEKISSGTLVKLAAVNGLVDALRQHGLVKVLAEPTLATVSGRPATFQSGGEFPVVVPGETESQAVEYRQFGTRVDCMAQVLDSGRIRLELRATVAEIDNSRSVTIQERPVPGLRTRSVDTAVELAAGQTLALSGLRQQRPKDSDDSSETEEIALLLTVTANLAAPAMQAETKGEPKRR